MLKSSVSTTGEDTEVEMTTRSLARLIKTITNDTAKEIVLLSCANERAAQNLVNKLGGGYRVVSWTGAVKVFDNGFIQGQGICKRYSPATSNSINAIVLSGTDIPKGKATTPTANFVLLAVSVCNDLETAVTSRATMASADQTSCKTALVKLCGNLSTANKTNVATRLSASSADPFTNTELKAFCDAIMMTGQGDRHISEHLSELGAEQLSAYHKLYTSGFETDFEYIRTLVKIKSYNPTITVNGAKNVTILHNGLTTTFDNDTIRAQGGIGDHTRSAERNQILNIVPLIREVSYITTKPAMTRYITFITDTAGRVKEIRATLEATRHPAAARRRDDSQSQNTKNVKNGTSVDQGGHMIAALFDGTVEQINYLPQKQATNVGPWKIMENQWAAQRDAGVSVEVNIKPQFSGNSKRPTWFDVDFSYGGGVNQNRPIQNP